MKTTFLLITLLILFSCSNETGVEYDISFETIAVQREEVVEVFVNIDGKQYRIESVSGMGMGSVEKEKFSDFDIPSDAIDAIEGFWAGFQTIFYIKDLDKEISVRKAERDEMDNSPLKYEEVVRIRKDENLSDQEVTSNIYIFEEVIHEGDDLYLKFSNNEKTIVVWEAPEAIWNEFNWRDNENSLKGKSFDLEFDEENSYLSKCELSNKKNTSFSQKSVQKEFYILNILAVKNKSKAIEEVEKLIQKGYEADFLWIPDYNSLSKAEYYSVYIGPFKSQRDCEEAVEKYRKKVPEAYGLLVSQENKRVQINGIDKVKITEP